MNWHRTTLALLPLTFIAPAAAGTVVQLPSFQALDLHGGAAEGQAVEVLHRACTGGMIRAGARAVCGVRLIAWPCAGNHHAAEHDEIDDDGGSSGLLRLPSSSGSE